MHVDSGSERGDGDDVVPNCALEVLQNDGPLFDRILIFRSLLEVHVVIDGDCMLINCVRYI